MPRLEAAATTTTAATTSTPGPEPSTWPQAPLRLLLPEWLLAGLKSASFGGPRPRWSEVFRDRPWARRLLDIGSRPRTMKVCQDGRSPRSKVNIGTRRRQQHERDTASRVGQTTCCGSGRIACKSVGCPAGQEAPSSVNTRGPIWRGELECQLGGQPALARGASEQIGCSCDALPHHAAVQVESRSRRGALSASSRNTRSVSLSRLLTKSGRRAGRACARQTPLSARNPGSPARWRNDDILRGTGQRVA